MYDLLALSRNQSQERKPSLGRFYPKKRVRVIMTEEQFARLNEAVEEYQWHGNEMTVLLAMRSFFGDAFVDALERDGGYVILADAEGKEPEYPIPLGLEVFDVRSHNVAAAKEGD